MADRTARAPVAAASIVTRPFMPLSSWLECCAHRELNVADLFLARGGRIESVVYPDRPEGRLPSNAGADGVFEVRQVDGGADGLVRPVHVAHIEEERSTQVEGQGHRVLEVAQDLEVATDLGARAVFRRDVTRLEAPDGVRAAEEVPLEERDRTVRPAQLVPRGQPPAQDVIEPEGLVTRSRDRDTEEPVVVGADPRKIAAEEQVLAAGRLLDAV